MRKLLLYFLVLLGFLSISNGACYIEFTSNIGPDFGTKAVYTNSLYSSKLGDYPSFYGPFPGNSFKFKLDTNVKTKIFYAFKEGRRIDFKNSNHYCGFSFTGTITDGSFGPFSDFFLSPTYYDYDLTGGKCRVDSLIQSVPSSVSLGNSFTFSVIYDPSIERLTFSDHDIAYIPDDLRRDYYDMNSNLRVKLIDSSGAITELGSQTKLFDHNNFNVNYNIPNNLPIGTYTIKVETDTNNEPKCNGLRDNQVETKTFQVVAASCPIQGGPDLQHGESRNLSNAQSVGVGSCQYRVVSCNDGTLSDSSFKYETCQDLDLDDDTIQNDVDNCPLNYNPGQENFDRFYEPSDNKVGDVCDDDKDNDGVLNNDEGRDCIFTPLNLITYVNGSGCLPDSDGDGVEDPYDYNGNLDCKFIEGDPLYGGCKRYGLDSCSGNYVVNSNDSIFFCLGNDDRILDIDYSKTQRVGREPSGITVLKQNGPLSVTPTQDARYLCSYDGNFGRWGDEIMGYCDYSFRPQVTNFLPYTPPSGSTVTCTQDGVTLNEGDQTKFYKKSFVKANENCEEQIRSCGSTGDLSGNPDYKYFSCDKLDPNYNNVLIEDSNGSLILEENDGITKRKVKVDLVNQKAEFINKDGTKTQITLPQAPTDKKITIIKNGINIRNDTIDPIKIALVGHKIRKHKNSVEAENFVDETVRLMKKFDITKDLTYNPINNKTRVKIKLNNILESERTNLTIYQVIDKQVAPRLSDITILNEAGAKRTIIDRDPVIGWYFNESSGDEEIEYETDGENEGGTIIITQEAILFNEGDLTINYRETSCNVGEAHLFDLEDLEDSKISAPNSNPSAIYKVCISHTTETLYASNVGDTDLRILNFSNDGYATLVGNWTLDNLVDLSVNQPSGQDVYWDLKIQENNPAGDYSCLGSITNTTNSLFGDCGFSSKRIWLHLGEDITPPTTNISVPFISHSIRVQLIPRDNIGGSGVDQTFYCYDEANICNPNQLYTGEFGVSCPTSQGCIRYVRTYSTDIEGNVESVKSYPVRLIDKGSACQADCTAKPSPNRYLKECRNLNSCKYYDVNGDDGLAVSNACDFLSEGSWVKLNSTTDVQCPNGPIRNTRFVTDGIQVEKLGCDNLLSRTFATLLEGETVKMKIFTCQDEE